MFRTKLPEGKTPLDRVFTLENGAAKFVALPGKKNPHRMRK
jgi:hypothetical protein